MNITTLQLKRGVSIICDILKQTESAYHIRVLSIQGWKEGDWMNGDRINISKDLIKS